MSNQYPQQPGPPPKKGMSTCLIVAIVLGIIAIPVIGVMATLGIYGFRRYLSSAKTSEAKSTVGAIMRAGTAAYERENEAAELIPSGKSAPPMHRVCATAKTVPAAVPAAAKYQPSSAPGADFNSGNADAGWTCLKFSMTQPVYYQYSYAKGIGTGKGGATASGFEASARGDLDGNGTTSLFARGADVRNGLVVVSTQLYIENEFE